MARFFINAQINIANMTPRFDTQFVVVAPSQEIAGDLANEYLVNEWYADHYTYRKGDVGTVIVHDVIVEQLNAEQVARRMTRARIDLKKRVRDG